MAGFMPLERHPSMDAGRFLRDVLGAVESELEYIPDACVVCHLPGYSGCPTCGYHWCDGCRRYLSFCAMCGSSDDED